MTTQTIAVNPGHLLGIIERQARQLYQAVSDPSGNINPEGICKHIAEMYGFAEQLNELAKLHAAANGNGSEAEQKAS